VQAVEESKNLSDDMLFGDTFRRPAPAAPLEQPVKKNPFEVPEPQQEECAQDDNTAVHVN
jgi:hypothetical protein